MIPLAAIPLLWRAVAIAVAVAALLGLYRWWAYEQREIGRWEVRAEWQAEREQQKDAALREAAANAAETERRLRAQKEAQDVHEKAMAQARADAAAANAAAGRLRHQLAAFSAAHRGATSNPAPVSDSPPAESALDLLAGLLSGSAAALTELAAFADAAHAAGKQCEREHDSLTDSSTRPKGGAP